MTDARGNDPDEREDELMRRIVLGECEPDAPEVRRRAAEDAAFARELEGWLRLRDRLESTFDDDRAIVAAATRAVSDGDRRLVQETLPTTGPIPTFPSARASRSWRPAWPVALAALLLVALGLFLARPWQGDPGGGGGTLSTDYCERPVAGVRGFAPFVVDYSLPPGSRLRITVEDPDTGEELLTSPDLRTTSWTPDDPETLRDRERIRWTFTIDSPFVTGSAEAWLRR